MGWKPWSDVTPGDVVRGRDGHDWTVTARSGMNFVMQREGKKPFAKVMQGNAEVTFSAVEEMRSATEEISNTLGGEVLHRVEDDATPACPPGYHHAGAMLAHLYLLHGVRYEGVKEEPTLSELNKMHENAHTEKNNGYIHHHHRADVLAVNGEEF